MLVSQLYGKVKRVIHDTITDTIPNKRICSVHKLSKVWKLIILKRENTPIA